MKPQKLFYGWKMMPAIWIIYFLGCGPSVYGISMLSTTIVLQRGWSESVIGLASGVVQYAIAVVSFLVPFYIRKKGYKKAIVLGGMVGTAGFGILTVFHASPVVYISMMAAVGFCDAFSCLTTIPGLIHNWFDRNKALPMSLVLCSGSVAGFVMPFLAAELLKKSSTICLLVYTVMSLFLVLLGQFCIIDAPEQVGEVKDGRAWTAVHGKEIPKEERKSSAGTGTPYYRSRPFWILMLVMIAFRSIYLIFSTYIVIYAVHRGVAAETAASFLIVGNAAGLVGRLCGGGVDRLHQAYHTICGEVLLLLGISGVVLYLSDGYAAMVCGAALLGFAFGFLQTLFPLLLPMYFGDEQFSQLYGTYNMIGGVFSGTLPVVISGVMTWLGGEYAILFLLLSIPVFAAALCMWVTPTGSLLQQRDGSFGCKKRKQ